MKREVLKKRKGFTLVELVIVIVIIGILAGIAGLAYSNVTGSAKDNVAKANLRSVKSAIMVYSTNNQGTLPTDLNDAEFQKLLEPEIQEFVKGNMQGYAVSFDGTELKVTGGGIKDGDSGSSFKFK